jgi:hypothetical protein
MTDHSVVFDWEDKKMWERVRVGVYGYYASPSSIIESTSIEESIHTKKQDNILAKNLLPLLKDSDEKMLSIVRNYKPLAPWNHKNDNLYCYFVVRDVTNDPSPELFFESTLFSKIMELIICESVAYDHIISELYDYVIRSYKFGELNGDVTMFGKKNNDITDFFKTYLRWQYKIWEYFSVLPCRGGRYEYYLPIYNEIINFIKFVIKSGLVDLEPLSIRDSFNMILEDISKINDIDIINSSKLKEIESEIRMCM